MLLPVVKSRLWIETVDTYIVVNVAVLEEFYHIRLELYVKRKVKYFKISILEFQVYVAHEHPFSSLISQCI